MTIDEVQVALRRAGFDPGPIDGIMGPLTKAAVRAFQVSAGLAADGIAGPKTIAWLRQKRRGNDGRDGKVPWMAVAQSLIGTAEAEGPSSNLLILDWARQARLPYGSDATPWCGLFIAHCINTALPQEPLPDEPLLARQWAAFGRDVVPQPGAIMVFWRGSKDGWQGHVGLFVAEDATHFHILGGNQADQVNIARIAKSRLLAARWPVTAPPGAGWTVQAMGSGATVSMNEA